MKKIVGRPLLNGEISKHFRKIMIVTSGRSWLTTLLSVYASEWLGRSWAANMPKSMQQLSTGQRAVTSLVFISSLVALASQRSTSVHEALESVGRVGKRYYLSFIGPTIREDGNPKLVIDDQTIQQYFPSHEEEFTTICER